MAHIIEIKNNSGSLKADVAPYNGGMISQINCNGVNILKMDYSSLETIPMLSGGIPFLFPFSSKTENDSYIYDGKKYYMPMHGLVKNAAFAVKKITSNSITLWLENNPAWKKDCYPFDFYIENEYSIHDNAITLKTSITNNSENPMPHYFGWHPFFYSSDKSKSNLSHHNTIMYDYNNKKDTEIPHTIPLQEYWDHVFHSPLQNEFELQNFADNYNVKCTFDNDFSVLVVCTWVEDSLCIEPWCGVPDAINTSKFLQYIEPNKTKHFSMILSIQNAN